MRRMLFILSMIFPMTSLLAQTISSRAQRCQTPLRPSIGYVNYSLLVAQLKEFV